MKNLMFHLRKNRRKNRTYKRICRKHKIDETELLEFKKKLTKIAGFNFELKK